MMESLILCVSLHLFVSVFVAVYVAKACVCNHTGSLHLCPTHPAC
jgi:hypothetical protein